MSIIYLIFNQNDANKSGLGKTTFLEKGF